MALFFLNKKKNQKIQKKNIFGEKYLGHLPIVPYLVSAPGKDLQVLDNAPNTVNMFIHNILKS